MLVLYPSIVFRFTNTLKGFYRNRIRKSLLNFRIKEFFYLIYANIMFVAPKQ